MCLRLFYRNCASENGHSGGVAANVSKFSQDASEIPHPSAVQAKLRPCNRSTFKFRRSPEHRYFEFRISELPGDSIESLAIDTGFWSVTRFANPFSSRFLKLCQSMHTPLRQSTGNPRLDQALGGGLIPGTLTVVMGATGIGKTQLGVSYGFAGLQQEGQTGILFDLTTRGDSQHQPEYASKTFGWQFRERTMTDHFDPAVVWEREQIRSDYLHAFHRGGRRVTIGDMQPEEWHEFKADLMRRLDQTIAFFYGNFVHGVRRCIVDGVEPTPKDADSFQFHLFDYIYHQVLRKDYDWLARDLFRVHFRQQEPQVMAHPYDHQAIGGMLLYTSHEVMLDDLIARPIQSGDVLSNANTIILMGKTRNGSQIARAVYVAKHRGSACEESILSYHITERGLEFDS